MPRNVKESDDEFETKGGRKTRTMIGSSVLDSPLRRSTRIKPPVAQNESSPESNSDVSSLGGSRNIRRRTTALDVTIPETRNLRTRRNSAASDISELAENDSTGESTTKRFTRRSIANLPSVETPTKMLAKARRSTRAGSESKSTPPVGRVTRRTRASSMEPEATEEIKNQETETPLKSKRRASALPSEPALVEESEEIQMEKTVFEIDEDESESTPNVSKSPRRKSKGDTSEFIENMEVDEAPVEESEVGTTEKTFREETTARSSSSIPKAFEGSPRVPDSLEKSEDSSRRQSISSPVTGSSHTIDNLLNKSAELQEIVVVREENEASNGSARTSLKNITQEVRSSPRISEKRGSLSLEDERSVQEMKMSSKIHQIVSDSAIADKILAKRDYSLDTECVVVIEPMNVDITCRKFDPPTGQGEKQQQKFNIEAEKAARNSEEDKENEEARNDFGLRITNVMSVVQKASEDEIDEEKECEEITEFDVSPENVRVREPPEIMINDEKSSTNRSIEDVSIRESSMDEDIADRFDNSEVEIVVEEPASPASNDILGPSTNGRTPSKSAENGNTCEIVEVSTVDENPSDFDDEILSCKIASPSAKIITRESSMDKEIANNTEETDGKIGCEMVKDRKSSAVTESPSGETNAEESARSRVRDVAEEASESVGITSKASEQPKNGENGTERENNKGKDEFRVSESENESEIVECPSFKDIPAEEWANDEATRGKIDEDSIHSFSTERNESECDIALVDKEPWQPSELDGEADKSRKNFNYDSDETVIARIEKRATAVRGEGRNIGEEATNDETSRDLPPSDVVDEDDRKKSDPSSTRRRSSLNDSTRSADRGDIDSNGENDRSIGLDASESEKRKSLNESRLDSCETATELRESEEEKNSEEENEEEIDESGRNGSKIEDRNTNSEIEEDPRESSVSSRSKNRKSVNSRNASKIALVSSSESEIDNEDSTEAFNVSIKSRNGRKSLNSSRSRSSIPRASPGSEEDDDNSRETLDESSRSKKSRESLNGKDSSRIVGEISSSDSEENDNSMAKLDRSNRSSSKNESSKSKKNRRSTSVGNDSKIEAEDSDGEFELIDLRSSLDRSRKSTSAEKSPKAKNQSRTKRDDSEFVVAEIESSRLDEEGAIDSESDVNGESDSTDDEDESNVKIPRFLYDVDTDSDDSDKSINSDIANEMNLAGERDLEYSDDDVPGDDCMMTESESYDSEDDDGEDLRDFVLSDDEYDSSEEMESDLDEDKTVEKKRKRIIPRPARDSDSAGSEEETSQRDRMADEDSPKSGGKSKIDRRTSEAKEKSSIIVSPEKSKSGLTPKSVKKRNDSATLMELEETIDENETEKIPTRRVKETLLDSSTPNIATCQNVSPEKTNSSKKKTKKKLESSISETIDTSTKLFASFNEATPKTPKLSRKSNARSSLENSKDSATVAVSPDVDSAKTSIHHQSMTGPITDSPEARFLMKEKLNDTLPALKLQQRTKRLRRSALDNLREESAKEKDEEAREEELSREATGETRVDGPEKKKKKKKKKKKATSDGNVDEVNEGTIEAKENASSSVVDDGQEFIADGDETTKSKKRKRNEKKSETIEIEEPTITATEEIPTKKKKKKPKKKDSMAAQEMVPDRAISDGKKKKKTKLGAVKPEADLSNRKSALLPSEIDFSGNERESTTSRGSQPLEKYRSRVKVTNSNVQESKGREKSTKVAATSSMLAGSEKLTSSVKRLPDDLLENLAEISERPKKRRKIVGEKKILPSKRMFSPGRKASKNLQVRDDFISLSTSGGTTRFGVVDLEKATKKSKKSVAAKSFRERMLARNPRQPISAYLMYQQKQKVSGKNQLH